KTFSCARFLNACCNFSISTLTNRSVQRLQHTGATTIAVQPQPSHQLAESLTSDAQFRRGAGAVTAGPDQGGAYELRVEGSSSGREVGRCRDRPAPELWRKRGRGDDAAPRDADCQRGEYILQFPHVSGPIVERELSNRGE